MMVAIRGRSNPKRPWKKRVNLEPRPSSFRTFRNDSLWKTHESTLKIYGRYIYIYIIYIYMGKYHDIKNIP